MTKRLHLFVAKLTRRPIDLVTALRSIRAPEARGRRQRAHPDTGAVVGFTGIIRATEGGRPLRGIQYEQYQAMAMKEMHGILEEARARWTLQAAVAIHRVGRTLVGQPSVAVAVAAGHRGPAFEAARFLIDSIKARVPLWKNFLYEKESPGGSAGAAGKSLIAVPVSSPPKSIRALAQAVRRGGGNTVELRADTLMANHKFIVADLKSLVRAIRRAEPGLLILLTLRSHREGGAGRLTDARRVVIIRELLNDVDAVDIELSSSTLLRQAGRKVLEAGRTLILSHHDFASTPSTTRLDDLARKASAWPTAILKIAATSKTAADTLRIAEWLLRHRDARPVAGMTMGDGGRAGRVLLAALGSRLSFAALGETSAPGQVELTRFARAVRSLRRQVRFHGEPTRSELSQLLTAARQSLGK